MSSAMNGTRMAGPISRRGLRVFRFENPSPYALEDEYSGSLLIAEYKAALTAAEKKAFLKRMLKTGVSVPLAIAEEAFTDRGPAVRIYAASHLYPVYKEYDWTSEEPFWDTKPKILKDFEAELANDPRKPWCAPPCSATLITPAHGLSLSGARGTTGKKVSPECLNWKGSQRCVIHG